MNLRSAAKYLARRFFITKTKVYILGKRIHHSYVGALIALLSFYFNNLVGLLLGIGLVVHDAISHLLVRYLGEAP
ncbi:MAG: hypothetical protein J7L98_00400 [Candidatus Verstraetearchaeota archaeon]|nr:hypothetical protein [Candidatus Verstraetearchaeota archaeon]